MVTAKLRHWLAALVYSLVTSSAFAAGSPAPALPPLGKELNPAATSLTVRSIAGKSQSWGSVLERDRHTLVVFATLWCQVCRKERPKLEAWAKSHARIARTVYVVSGSGLADVREAEPKATPFVDVMIDEQGQLADHYGIRQTPTLLLFGPTQRLRGTYAHLADVPLSQKLVEVTDSGRELATSYDVVVNVPEGDEARARADLKDVREQVRKWEAQLSEWRKDSEITRLNEQAAAGPVKVSPSLLQIVRGALNVAGATNGAFDITWRPLDALWHQAEQSGQLPAKENMAQVLEAIGSKQIVIEGQTIAFRHPKTQIGIAGVAKGWIVDSTFLALRRRGYSDILVNMGGDLRTAGREPDGTKHIFQVIDPYNPSLVKAELEIENAAVATSGNYIRQRYVGDKVIGHIFDPRTGFPPTFDGSITLITADAAMADALATGLFVMGPESGTAFAKQHPGVDVLYITRQGATGTIAVRHGAPKQEASASSTAP